MCGIQIQTCCFRVLEIGSLWFRGYPIHKEYILYDNKKVKKKVKVTLVQALRLCRGRTAHMGE